MSLEKNGLTLNYVLIYWKVGFITSDHLMRMSSTWQQYMFLFI